MVIFCILSFQSGVHDSSQKNNRSGINSESVITDSNMVHLQVRDKKAPKTLKKMKKIVIHLHVVNSWQIYYR